MPIGPLMREHRLIEKMVDVLKRELDRMNGQDELDPAFIDTAVDFFRTYADRTHHGKEEDILFRDLAKKELQPELREMMEELIQEHAYARKTVGELLSAKEGYVGGDGAAVEAAKASMKKLVELYPRHIEKEDKSFFYPSMGYFDEEELEGMLKEFWDFDREMIQEKYAEVVRDSQVRYESMGRWRCRVCGYVYDAVKGDPEYGLKPGVPFEELPEDWFCPVCSAPKDQFERID